MSKTQPSQIERGKLNAALETPLGASKQPINPLMTIAVKYGLTHRDRANRGAGLPSGGMPGGPFV